MTDAQKYKLNYYLKREYNIVSIINNVILLRRGEIVYRLRDSGALIFCYKI